MRARGWLWAAATATLLALIAGVTLSACMPSQMSVSGAAGGLSTPSSAASAGGPPASSSTGPTANPLTPAIKDAWPLGSACRSSAGRRERIEMALYGYPDQVGLALSRPQASGELLPVGSSSVHACDRRVWLAVQALYPRQALAMVEDLVIFDGPTGSNEATGFVHFQPQRDRVVTLGLDPYAGDDWSDAALLIHELGHLLQLDPARDTPPCRWWSTDRHCAQARFLADFVAAFWPARLRAEWASWADVGGLHTNDAKLFHEEHPGQFVSWYATTSPAEDQAETLMYWCIGEPVTGALAQAKVDWISRRPELVGLAERCARLRTAVD